LSAVARIRVLEAGGVLYKAVDFGYSADQASNCIHAVSSVVAGQWPPLGPLSWGETASFRLLDQFDPWIIEPSTVHTCVRPALGAGPPPGPPPAARRPPAERSVPRPAEPVAGSGAGSAGQLWPAVDWQTGERIRSHGPGWDGDSEQYPSGFDSPAKGRGSS